MKQVFFYRFKLHLFFIPSVCSDFYKGWPSFQRVLEVRKSEKKICDYFSNILAGSLDKNINLYDNRFQKRKFRKFMTLQQMKSENTASRTLHLRLRGFSKINIYGVSHVKPTLRSIGSNFTTTKYLFILFFATKNHLL